MKISEFVERACNELAQNDLYYGHGTDNPFDEAVYLSYASLGFDFPIENQIDRELSSAELHLLEQQLGLRIEQQIPVAYIVGKAWFAGYPFFCDERALVPRSPIAELILNRFEPLLSTYPFRVLDLCTGGGSIGIATALELPECTVTLADISERALALADENIILHDLGSRVKTIHSNLFQAVEDKYQLILSNPPYVSRAEINDLPGEFLHEPELGLLSEDDGLEIPLQIMREAAEYLTDSGLLIMEVGYSNELLSSRLKDVPILWLVFENGGEGVLAMTAAQLRQYREYFI